MSKDEKRQENIRSMNAFAIVSSLAMMIVCDFFLAYYGGNWLDEYFETGDHSIRLACICLAIASVFMTFFHLVSLAMDREKDK